MIIIMIRISKTIEIISVYNKKIVEIKIIDSHWTFSSSLPWSSFSLSLSRLFYDFKCFPFRFYWKWWSGYNWMDQTSWDEWKTKQENFENLTIISTQRPTTTKIIMKIKKWRSRIRRENLKFPEKSRDIQLNHQYQVSTDNRQ